VLALLMGLGEDFEQFFANCNRLSLVTDHFLMLYIATNHPVSIIHHIS
jgi:hypothetical protein